jgi:hypothetical protein
VPLWTRIIKIPWGQVELRPAEKTAEDLFNKFGNHPWVGGDPWTFQKDMVLPQLQTKKVQKDTSSPSTFASAAKKSSNLSYISSAFSIPRSYCYTIFAFPTRAANYIAACLRREAFIMSLL